MFGMDIILGKHLSEREFPRESYYLLGVRKLDADQDFRRLDYVLPVTSEEILVHHQPALAVF